MKSDFMQRMKETMQEKGIRQTDLVEKTGIDKGALSSYMNGRYMPNAEKVAKIAKALCVSVDYLLGKEEAQTEKPPKIHEVSVLGKVAAGVPISAQEDIIGSNSGVHPFRFHDLRSFSASAMLSEIKVARSTAKAVHGWKTDRMLDQHYDREIANVKRKDEKKIVRYISKNIHIKRNG